MQEGAPLQRSGSAGSRDGAMSTMNDDMVSHLQDKLEVSYQWAFDLESDLVDALESARLSDRRCQALEAAMSERDAELQRASLPCLGPVPCGQHVGATTGCAPRPSTRLLPLDILW